MTQAIKFTCEVTTPMFLSGADGKTPELRPASIKGVLRFWWRAMHRHLDLETLKKQEGNIFGDTSQRSQVIVHCVAHKLATIDLQLIPHKRKPKQHAIIPGQVFSVTLGLSSPNKAFDLNKLQTLFELACILGGFGKRVRRGMGSIRITAYQLLGAEKTLFSEDTSLSVIEQKLKVFSPYFASTRKQIYQTWQGRSEAYPWIETIELGKPAKSVDALLEKISNTTHLVKQGNPSDYGASLGQASEGRFASPVFVSVTGTHPIPVITTLHAASKHGQANTNIQTTFKNKILGTHD